MNNVVAVKDSLCRQPAEKGYKTMDDPLIPAQAAVCGQPYQTCLEHGRYEQREYLYRWAAATRPAILSAQPIINQAGTFVGTNYKRLRHAGAILAYKASDNSSWTSWPITRTSCQTMSPVCERADTERAHHTPDPYLQRQRRILAGRQLWSTMQPVPTLKYDQTGYPPSGLSAGSRRLDHYPGVCISSLPYPTMHRITSICSLRKARRADEVQPSTQRQEEREYQ